MLKVLLKHEYDSEKHISKTQNEAEQRDEILCDLEASVRSELTV